MQSRATRRAVLRAGALGALALPGVGGGAAQGAGPTLFGKARRVILLYLYGAAAQHETWDPKPDAPLEIRGKFNPIATAVPGVQICEHLPRVAKLADRLAIVRSMSHPFNIHSAAYTLSGIDKVDIPMELNPFDSRHWPSFGSVVDYLAQTRDAKESVPKSAADIPRNMCLPFRFSSRCAQFTRGGPYGGFLGRAFDPVCTEFDGQITGRVGRWTGSAMADVEEPYLGIAPEGRFVAAKAGQLDGGITLDRLDTRRSLLAQFDQARRELDAAPGTRGHSRARELAYSLLTSPTIREALDISRETAAKRETYGMNLFGQATLAGRRLLEAGATIVTVLWDEITIANSAWDTHFHHYERLETELLPGLDRAMSSLLVDLEERGMLDDTLVLCLTEHGRTPKLHDKGPHGVGREHWSDVYSNVLAGAGIRRGAVIGASDKHGAFVKENPISPKDILATIYHLLGIDHEQSIPDRLGRPFPLVSGGRVVEEMVG
jgi:uncharacterized protein (DUF1501 family)